MTNINCTRFWRPNEASTQRQPEQATTGRQGEEGEGGHGRVAGLGDRGLPSPHSPAKVLALWHEQLLSVKDNVTQQGP